MVVIEADITIEVAVDIIAEMGKVVTVATGAKVMIIVDSKMETTLGATGSAVTGTKTVVAEDLTMEIGEVAKIIAVDGKINQEMVKTVTSQDKIEITETENGLTMNMTSRKQDRRRNRSHKGKFFKNQVVVTIIFHLLTQNRYIIFEKLLSSSSIHIYISWFRAMLRIISRSDPCSRNRHGS